jgi:hypothetical protein
MIIITLFRLLLDSASPVYPCQERHYVCFWAVAWQVPLGILEGSWEILGAGQLCKYPSTVTGLGATSNRFPAGQIGAASLAPRGPRLTIGLGGVFQGFLGEKVGIFWHTPAAWGSGVAGCGRS